MSSVRHSEFPVYLVQSISFLHAIGGKTKLQLLALCVCLISYGTGYDDKGVSLGTV